MKGVMSLGKNIMNSNSGAAEKTKQSKTSPADAISFSGCKDSQTVSADIVTVVKAKVEHAECRHIDGRTSDRRNVLCGCRVRPFAMACR
jgi:hypothetical protein